MPNPRIQKLRPSTKKNREDFQKTKLQQKRREARPRPDKSLAERALDNYWDFLELIEFRGGHKAFGAVHEELCNFVGDSSHPRRMVLMPRGHLKSTICSVGYSLWRIWLNPCVRIRVGTATKPLATAFVREVKQYLENPDLQERVWNNRPHIPGPLIPALDGTGRMSTRRERTDDENFSEEGTEALDKKVVWKADAIQVVRPVIMKEPTLVASSVGSPDTGFHADLFIGDDVVTFSNSDTPTKRENILRWIADQESVIDPWNPLTRLGGETVLLGTRYFYQDLYGLYSNEDLTPEELEDLRAELGESWQQDEYTIFKRNIFVNGINDEQGYLWPERFNAQVLDGIRRRMLKQPNGARRFASQYLNKVYSEEDTTLAWEKVQPISNDDVSIDVSSTTVTVRLGERYVQVRPVIAVDPAISQRATSDYTAISVLGVTGEREVILLDLTIEKLSPSDTMTRVYEYLTKYGLKSFWLDSEKLGMALKHTFRDSYMAGRDGTYPVTILDYRAVGDKRNRLINTLEPIINNELLHATPQVRMNKLLQQEISFFGQAGIHDDGCDAICMAIEKALPLPPGGGLFSTNGQRNPREHYQFHSLANLARLQSARNKFNPVYGGLR